MPKSFSCSLCGETVVVKFLNAGDLAICPKCLQRTPVPEDAVETDQQPAYLRLESPTATTVPAAGPEAPEGGGAPGTPGPVDEGPRPTPPREGECLNHPGTVAVTVCSMCAEPFCAACVDFVGHGSTCHSCRPGPKGKEPVEQLGSSWSQFPAESSKLARDALIMSLVGIVCCGIILEPLALYKAIKAKREIRNSPQPMAGEGKATAAIVISSIVLALNALFLLMRILAIVAATSHR